MKRTLLIGLLSAALVPALSGCGPSEEERRQAEMEEAAQDLQDAAERLGEATGDEVGNAMESFGEALGGAAGAAQDGARYDPVDRERLRALIPESIGGMERTSINSAREGAMGMTVTFAEADYRDGEGQLDLKVTDMAGLPFAGMMGAAWATADIDRESDQEVERTLTHRGHRGHMKYNKGSRSGEMQVLVAGRFLVEAQGRNVDVDRIQEAVDAVSFRALEGMRGEGRRAD